MRSVSVAEAKAHMSEILTEVEQGREVVITRRGKPVARVSAIRAAPRPLDLEKIRRHLASLPVQEEDSETAIRRLRDEARY
jgi:prevent-host-death family protein